MSLLFEAGSRGSIVFKIRILGLFLLMMIGTVLASQYQNCTNISPSSKATYQTEAEDFLSLNSTSLMVSDLTKEFLLEGNCSKKMGANSDIEWTLYQHPYRIVESGNGKCENGKFSAQIIGLEKMNCQEPYSLKTSFKDSGSLFETQVEIIKNCPPLSRQIASVVEAEQQCFYEKRRFASAGEQCVRSCYQQGLIKSQKMVQLADCGSEQKSDDPQSFSKN